MMLKHDLSTRRIVRFGGMITLLLSVLLLPLLHLHPAYDHAHGDAERHQHQPAVHADFFTDTTHGHEHHDDHDQHGLGINGAAESSHHALSQIDLLSLHIPQSLQFASVFKKNSLVSGQYPPDLSIFLHFQRGAFYQQNPPLLQAPRFSLPSLRAPPFYA